MTEYDINKLIGILDDIYKQNERSLNRIKDDLKNSTNSLKILDIEQTKLWLEIKKLKERTKQ